MAPLRMMMLLLALTHQCTSQSCLSDGITFTSQDQIDNFTSQYPNCTTIEGDVKIGDFEPPYYSTDIIDLSGLSNVTQINGSLNLFYNSVLPDMAGLSNLIYIGGAVTIDNNDALIDLSGLDNIVEINGTLTVKSNEHLINLLGLGNVELVEDNLYVSTNPSLTSFAGLESLINVNGYFSIANNDALINFEGLNALNNIGNFVHVWSNDELQSLQGLESLSSIGGFLAILHNENLLNIDGISNLQSLGSYLSIHDNDLLNSIQGIENIDPVSIQATSSSQNDIEFYDNLNLNSCALDNVCSVLNTPNSKIVVYNNGLDCESIGDLDSICNPICGIVNTKNSSGEGSLLYNLDCIMTNDTITIDESLSLDTIWLSESCIDIDKSFVIKGPNDGVLIASTMDSPLISNGLGDQIHLININLHKFYPIVDTIINNQGTLILENCNIYAGPHNIYQSDAGQMIVRGTTRIEE